MQVKRIGTHDTFPIRNQMLRPKGVNSDYTFPGDDDDLTFHLGGFEDKQLVSIASFYFHKHPYLPGPYHFQLRGMATLSEYQKRGLSSALIKAAVPLVKQNQCNILWCNARIDRVGFYEKIGFQRTGTTFNVPEIGEHLLVFYEV